MDENSKSKYVSDFQQNTLESKCECVFIVSCHCSARGRDLQVRNGETLNE